MRKLKLFLSLLMVMFLSVGNVWAEVSTLTFTAKANGSGTADDGASWTVTSDGTESQFDNTKGIHYGTNSAAVQYIKLTTNDISGTITKVVVNASTANGVSATASVTVGGDTFGGDAQSLSNSTAEYTFIGSASGEIVVTVTKPSSATKAIYCKSVAVTYTSGGGGGDPDPTVSADPDKVENVAAEGVIDQTIELTYENITDYVTEVSVHPNADGTGTLSLAWLTASVSDADNYATVTYSVSANEGAARTAYIKVYTTDGEKEAETIIPVSQAKYSAPTGTFELFSGDLVEGDYVFVVDAKAMTNSVSSSRLANTNVTIATDQITNPDESIIWHVAASGDYWTIYNAAVEKYAASNGTKNQAALTVTEDDKILWSVDKSGNAFNFENKYNAANSVNAKLQRNGDYGWACYSAYSNISLYKKQVAGQPKAPTFSVPGGNYENAQSVELSCETQGAKIYYTLDGSKPSSTSTEYSTAIPVSATTTIKAVAIKDEIESTVATATYTIVVWQTVDEIWSSITSEGPTNANVWGYVSQANVGGYNNNYYISVNGSLTANQLEIYKGDNAGNTVAVGDKVHVNGDLTIFNEIKEFKQNTGVIVHYSAKGALQSVAVSGTPTKTEYAANETFDPAGLKVYGTYANGFVGEITEGITWGNDLTDGKVTESTTVHVTATVSEVASPAYEVAVTVAAKTLVSIAVDVDSYTIYTGEVLPQPNVTATYSEGDPENVNALAVYDSESVFDTEVIDDPDPQTITVSYTFGGATQTATYTVSVKDYANADDAPYTVTEALHIITDAIGNAESAREIVVAGTVNEENISNNKNRYKISDGVNELLVYAGKGFNNETFTNTNYPKVGDVVKVKGKVINYNNNTPEFATGKSYLLSQVRPATIAIENVASFEVGATDLTESDLDITTPSDGDITFVSGDDAVATIEANAIHAVAPGTVTITANLAATENVDALNYAATSTTFSVTVVAPATKYAITFDGNGADGGSAPVIADKAAGVSVDLPANSFTYAGHLFAGWKVFNDDTSEEIEVNAGAFEMPASTVTIQAQWEEISVWATTYTSNVTLSYTGTGEANSQVKINDEDYAAQKVGSSGNDGSVVVTVPYGTHTLHFHAVAWNGKSVTIAASGVENMSESSFTLAADPGFKSSGTYTLENDPVGQYFVMTFTAVTEETQITFSKTAGDDKRFMLYGVNQEGGIFPVLESLAISGDLENKTYEAGASLNMAGLTVMGTYTLAGTPQTPVDVTDQVEEWLYDVLQVGDESVTISAKIGDVTSAGFEITGLTVTDPTPRFETNPTSYISFGTKTQGTEIAARDLEVTLVNVDAASVAISGDGAAAFSVDENALTANATLHVSASSANLGTFNATLTISDDAGVADDKEISLSLTITAPEVPETAVETDSKWVPATAIEDGMEVLITGIKSDVVYAMGEQKSNNRSAVAGTLSEGVFTPGENTLPFTLVATGETDTYYIKASNDKYLYNASTSGNSYLRTKAENEDASWTITLDGDGNAVITSVENTNRTLMRFNLNGTNTPLFNCYASGQQSVKLYVPKQDTPEPPTPSYETVRTDLTAGNYYTTCLPKKVVAVKGASFWNMSKRNAAGTEVYLEEAELPFTAGAPYIIRATADKLEVVYDGDPANGPVENGALRGTLTGLDVDAINAIADDIYMLKNNALHPVLANNGNYLAANRAYVLKSALQPVNQAPQAPGKRVVAMPMHQDQATGVDELNAAEAPVKMIIDGQLFILRGEKMYDATGRLVK